VPKTLGAIALVCALSASVLAARPAPAVQSDLDDFMKQVLANRDENWKKLQQYILEEREAVEVRGPSHVPVWGDRREYSWFIRDGYFIRSPVKANGVTIGEADRQKAEDSYLKRVKAQDKKQREKDDAKGEQADTAANAEKPAEAPSPEVSPPTDINSLLTQSRQPEFIDSAYFLRFKFEQGKYAFVGRETLDGRDVLRIEYYPSQLFTHEQDAQKKRDQEKKPNRSEDVEAAMERMMNKVSLITLWVEPKAHQIVKYTFDNVNFDFLPAAWLLRVNDLKASMTMSQPFPDVWLPHDVDFFFAAMIAVGGFDVRYHLEYHDYREAKTSGRFIIRTPVQ